MRNKNGEMNVGTLVFIGVMVIVCLVLIQAIAGQEATLTKKGSVFNESYSIAYARVAGGSLNQNLNNTVTFAPVAGSWQARGGCALTGFVFRNQTGATQTLTTDYLFDGTTGTVTVKNVTNLYNSASNTTYADYTYCQDGYNNDSGSRGVAAMITLFSTLALLAAILNWTDVKDLFNMD